ARGLRPRGRRAVGPLQPPAGRPRRLRRLLPATRRLELPRGVAEDEDALAVARDPGDVDLGTADHEVEVDLALVDPLAVLLADALLVRGPEGDVAGGVLVEQRVVEDGLQ